MNLWLATKNFKMLTSNSILLNSILEVDDFDPIKITFKQVFQYYSQPEGHWCKLNFNSHGEAIVAHRNNY